MESVKKCKDASEAVKRLLDGAYIFTKTIEDVVDHKKGCRKCNAARKGNFCQECGSKLTDKLPVLVRQDVTKYRIKLHQGEDYIALYMETMKPKETFYGDRKKCTLSLEFFLQFKEFYWIW